MSLGDLDSDGDLDAFVANGVHGDIGSQVWLNNGAGIFISSEQELGYGMGLDLGDLDSDGDLDVFLGVGIYGNAADEIWLNDGQGRFTNSGLSLGTDFSSGVGLGDLDGDGDLDAFVTHGELGLDSGGGMWLNQT